MALIARTQGARWNWLPIVLGLVAAVFLVAMAACGGGGDGKAKDQGSTATPKASSPAGGGATDAPAATSDSGSGNDATDALAKFASDYERFTGKVKYEIKDFSSADTAGLSSMAIYQSSDKSRVDIESAAGNVIIIDTPDASYTCTANQCLKSPPGDASANPMEGFAGFFDASTIQSEFGAMPEGTDLKTSKEKIAGLQATCISAKGDLDTSSPGDEEGEVCFAEGGLMLRIKFSSGGTSGTFEATEASTKVSDSDFEPPYDVTDLSELGQ